MSFKFLTAVSLLSVGLLLLAPARAARAHAYPTVSVPQDGAVIAQAPREVRIQFTEGVELEFSSIVVKSAAGEIMSRGKVRRLADDTLAVDVKPLGAGAYRIEWQALSVDTHVTDGVLRFTVTAKSK